MSLKVNSVFTLFVFILLSIIFVDRVCCQRLAFAQSSYNLDISDDPKNIIIKYCKQYADSASEGIDVIQDLIGAGIVPSSYYGTTCGDEINNMNQENKVQIK